MHKNYFFKKYPYRVQWPCEVVDEKKYTPDMVALIEKEKEKKDRKFLKIVKYLTEDFFEVVKDESLLRAYECPEKEDLIRVTFDSLQKGKKDRQELYKKDIIAIETLLQKRSDSLNTVWFDKIVTSKKIVVDKKVILEQKKIIKEVFSSTPVVLEKKVKTPGKVVMSTTTPIKIQQQQRVQVAVSSSSSSSGSKFVCNSCGYGTDFFNTFQYHRGNCVGTPKTTPTVAATLPKKRKSSSVAMATGVVSEKKKKKVDVVNTTTSTRGRRGRGGGGRGRGRGGGRGGRRKVQEVVIKQEEILKDWDDDTPTTTPTTATTTASPPKEIAIKTEHSDSDSENEEDKKMPELFLFQTFANKEMERKPDEEESKKKKNDPVKMFDLLFSKQNEVKEEVEVESDKETVDFDEDEYQELLEGEGKGSGAKGKEEAVTVAMVKDGKVNISTDEEKEMISETDELDSILTATLPPDISSLLHDEKRGNTTSSLLPEEEEKKEISSSLLQEEEKKKEEKPLPVVSKEKKPPMKTRQEKKPTATIKPSILMEQEIPQETVEKAQEEVVEEPSSSSQQPEEPEPYVIADQVMHLVPVENADGSITYLLMSLDQTTPSTSSSGPSNEVKVAISDSVMFDNQQQQQQQGLQGFFLDKTIDIDKLFSSVAVLKEQGGNDDEQQQQQQSSSSSSQVQGM